MLPISIPNPIPRFPRAVKMLSKPANLLKQIIGSVYKLSHRPQPHVWNRQCWLQHGTPCHLMFPKMDECQRENLCNQLILSHMYMEHTVLVDIQDSITPNPNSRFSRAVNLLSWSQILVQQSIGSVYKLQSHQTQQYELSRQGGWKYRSPCNLMLPEMDKCQEELQ